VTAPVGLFGRTVAVEIGPAVGGIARRIEGLRVSFRAEFKASKAVNKASVRIYNPAQSTIAALRLPGTVVRLFAGYGTLPRLLFVGAPTKDGIDVKTDGGDLVLDVDAADGGDRYASTFLQLSFATSTTFGQVLSVVLAQTQWSLGFVDPRVENVVLPHGIVLVGRPAEVLDRLAAAVPAFGADWYVRDGALYIVVHGGSTPEVAPLISAVQGNLVGSPNGTAKGVKLRALIDATMRPGRAFVLESTGWSGTFIAKDVTFTGDSGFAQDWYMDITATPPDPAAVP
jgi:hypothetical protein